MVEATVGVRIRSEGADELKTRLRELRTEFERGDISVTEYSKGLRGVNRDARAMTQQSQVATRVFLAQHPAINSLSRAMSTFGSISRTALSITTAFSVARLAFGGSTSALMELQSELAEAERNFTRLNEAGDEIGATEQKEKIDILKQKIKELNDSAAEEKIINLVNLGSTISLMGSSISSIIKNKDAFSGAFKGISGALGKKMDTSSPMGALSSFGSAAGTANTRMGSLIKNLPKIVGATAGVAVAINGITTSAEDFTSSLVGKAQTIGGMALAGAAIGGPFGAIAGGAVGAVIALIQTLEEAKKVANMEVDTSSRFANGNIRAGGPPTTTTSTVAPTSSLPAGAVRLGPSAIRLAGGQIVPGAHGLDTMVNGPTMFLAGEAGRQERVQIGNRSGGGSGTTIINNYINGSVLVERELWGIVNK